MGFRSQNIRFFQNLIVVLRDPEHVMGFQMLSIAPVKARLKCCKSRAGARLSALIKSQIRFQTVTETIYALPFFKIRT